MLLVLVTGEEKGLLGSKYFAAHPTVPRESIVADVNVDMFLPIVPLKLLTVYGLDESDLGDRTREVAQTLGSEGSGRSATFAQCFRAQRSVQLHTPGHTRGDGGHRSRAGHAGAEDFQRLADAALSRALRRHKPADRPRQRREIRRDRQSLASSTSPTATIGRSGSQIVSSEDSRNLSGWDNRFPVVKEGNEGGVRRG
jgi:hypothetical protein